MKLRTQLLLAGAVTFLLPLVAFHTVQQMDLALRESRVFELQKSASLLSSLLRHSRLLPAIDSSEERTPRDLYAERIKHRIALDGYGDDWANLTLPARDFDYADNKSAAVHRGGKQLATASVQLAVSGRNLHLLIDIEDDKVLYHRPRLAPVGSEFTVDLNQPVQDRLATGDHVVLFLQQSQNGIDAGTENSIQETVFSAIAPGPLKGRRYADPVDGIMPVVQTHRYRGYWTATNKGYQLEITLPAPKANTAFGFAVVDVDDEYNQSGEAWIGTVDPHDVSSIGTLVYSSTAVNDVLAEVLPKASRARLFDQHGRLRADVNRLYERPANPTVLDPAETNIFNALLFRFFEWIIKTRQRELSSGYSFEHDYQLTSDARSGIETAAPVQLYVTPDRDQVMGSLSTLSVAPHGLLYLLYETNEESANAFTSSAMVRMFTLVTLVGLLVALSLFAYASWLSWRVRNLSKQAKSAVSGDGRFLQSIEGSSARDEIGELSRSFAQLVERTAGYTQYLESLASRLSHELRTPLSVVQTSLENIESGDFSESDRQLLARAQGGTLQLAALVRSMSEASRLEQTVQRAERVHFDACNWLYNASEAYNDLHPAKSILCDCDRASDADLYAVPELLQQALDKLVGNAVDFSADGTPITIRARRHRQFLDISVTNVGSRIDESHSQQLFEPMYSERSERSDDFHLGLGLYIVRLIAEAHHGRAYARNLPARTGAQNLVQFGFTVLHH